MIDKLESVLLHDSPTFEYDRVLDQHDGRGYVAGRGDFSVAYGEALAVVETYTASLPDNALARSYLPTLRSLAAQRSADNTGLDGYPQAWRAASADPWFRQAQDVVMNDRYFAPASAKARELGITSALGLAVVYDSLIQHGVGPEPDSLDVLIARTNTLAGGQPSHGVDERWWLSVFLDVRTDVLARPANPARREMWPYTIGRVLALDELLSSRNDGLTPPLSVNPYGRVHVLQASDTSTSPPADVSPWTPPALGATPSQVATTRPTPLPQSATRVRIDYIDFADITGLILNGSALRAGSTLRLTGDTDQAGSFWSTTNIDPTRSFSTFFRFSIPNRTDGIAFVIQSEGTAALGYSGGGSRYGGRTRRSNELTIKPSLFVEFDMWEGTYYWRDAGQQVVVATTGDSSTALSSNSPSFSLFGAPVAVWIDYDAAEMTLSVYASLGGVRPAAPLTTANVNLAAVVGSGRAYVGFTGGTGGGGGIQDVLSWHLRA